MIDLASVPYDDLTAEIKRRRKLGAAMLYGPDTLLMLVVFAVGFLVGYLST